MGIAINQRVVKGSKTAARNRRHLRVRKKVAGTAARPRLVVTRSLRHMVAQVVDDSTGRTLVSASSLEGDLRSLDGDKTAKARKVGELIADRVIYLARQEDEPDRPQDAQRRDEPKVESELFA